MLRIRPERDFDPNVAYSTSSAETFDEDEGFDETMQEPEPEPEPDSEPVYAPVGQEARMLRAHGAQEQLASRMRTDPSLEPTIEVMRTRDPRPARIEPTFDETQTAELPVREFEPEPRLRAIPTTQDAPTLGMSSTPSPRRVDRRKILALRLAAGPQRLLGAELKAAFDAESLQHGKYDVFHRLDEQGAAVFSIASMVEPGTFDPDKMETESYPGITLFTQLPGPVAGMLAFNELLACSRRLHSMLGGTLQDERGVPLTVHRVERIRQEIREFEQRPAAEAAPRTSPTFTS